MERVRGLKESHQLAPRNAFTVVELLVALSVIAVLLAIIVPAVQSARQSARATECRNRMRNLILACHSVQSTSQRFPSAFKVFTRNGYGFSMHVQLLPYIENGDVLEQLDFALDPRAKVNRQVIINSTPVAFRCPESILIEGSTSYLGNSGSGLPPEGSSDFGNLRDGFLQRPPGSQPVDFRDGLSNTVAIAECPQMKKMMDPFGQFLLLNANVSDRDSWVQYRDQCWQVHKSQQFASGMLQGWTQGEYWASPQLPDTRYAHVFPPNSVSCFDNGGGSTAHAISTAGSHHNGFLNAAMADGSVRSFSFQIDPAVWAGIGKRDDGQSSLE